MAAPGQEACFTGDLTAGDPVAAITFPNEIVVYAYGRNPVIGRPDIRICADQDCRTSLAQFDLSEGDKSSKKVLAATYTATRPKDSASYKELRLTVS
jgi:hypothetical protein